MIEQAIVDPWAFLLIDETTVSSTHGGWAQTDFSFLIMLGLLKKIESQWCKTSLGFASGVGEVVCTSGHYTLTRW